MKIERAWLRIVVSVIVGGIAGVTLYLGAALVFFRRPSAMTQGWVTALFVVAGFLTGPIIATVIAHVLTPKGILDGHTRCGKCGYILKGLSEPRCSECGERI